MFPRHFTIRNKRDDSENKAPTTGDGTIDIEFRAGGAASTTGNFFPHIWCRHTQFLMKNLFINFIAWIISLFSLLDNKKRYPSMVE